MDKPSEKIPDEVWQNVNEEFDGDVPQQVIDALEERDFDLNPGDSEMPSDTL